MFKVGDVVQLKSGGPIMTITYVKDTNCECSWFKEEEVKRDSFPFNALEEYVSPLSGLYEE